MTDNYFIFSLSLPLSLSLSLFQHFKYNLPPMFEILEIIFETSRNEFPSNGKINIYSPSIKSKSSIKQTHSNNRIQNVVKISVSHTLGGARRDEAFLSSDTISRNVKETRCMYTRSPDKLVRRTRRPSDTVHFFFFFVVTPSNT